MTICKIRLHIICGACGSNEDLKYSIDEDPEYGKIVYITCGNCSTLTALSEVINKARD